MIKLTDISFNFSGSKPLFRNFSFTAEAGETVLVKGVSGSGKTSFLNILCGVIPKVIKGNFSGSVEIDDLDLESLSLPQIAPHVSLLMQDPDLQLFFPTVEQEIAFGPENLKIDPDEIKQRITNSLKMLKIEHLRSKVTANLSFGEKKLVALASLLTLDPDILLLDEPAAGISSEQIIVLKKSSPGSFGTGKNNLHS